ncbi:hypothetical protein QAD02_015455 [Eretmocerus hayati]|uniref:Uncharacterized protein n=1 Tax=Eretmocerus hayati TaxID=131215 RepID=A0ACC2P989_9HYME|nr:hypothetical protein QAD02_015455 [Eretmocerus hayati]
MLRAPGARHQLALLDLLLLLPVPRLLQAGLPPGAEDEIVVIEHLPGRRVHLQDFFWTGPEDAPPWLEPEQLLTYYKTHTVHHTSTVYLPEPDVSSPSLGNELEQRPGQPVDCAACIEPTPTVDEDVDQDIGISLDEDPGPRYWLLTVLQAGKDVPPKVELKLARLYKAAFTRQQQKHLGLLPPDKNERKHLPKRQILMENVTTTIEPLEVVASSSATDETTSQTPRFTSEEPRPQRPSVGSHTLRMRTVHISKIGKRTLPIFEPDESGEVQPNINPESSTVEDESVNGTSRQQRSPARLASGNSPDVGLVQVRMQNTSKLDDGATRLVYTVHLGGKPVPAETAAKDMALLSAQEVALELGAPVIIQSEPYLKESRPLALSRSRDAWLLAGAAGAGLLLFSFILLALIVATKRKRAQSAVSAPAIGPHRGQLIRKGSDDFVPRSPRGIDNTAYTSENEARTEVTSAARRTTPGSFPRTPGSQDTLEADARDMYSERELLHESERQDALTRFQDSRNYVDIPRRGVTSARRVQRANAIDQPRTPDSVDSLGGIGSAGQLQQQQHQQVQRKTGTSLEALEKGFGESTITTPAPQPTREASGSPHSYLSMPSCKQFPNMRGPQPLSKVLEPVVVKHLDLELESPEMKMKAYDLTIKDSGDQYFLRSSSETKDPGVLGPIVWDLKRKGIEGNGATWSEEADVEPGRLPHGQVGRARRRLNELIEDSLGVFGTREPRRPGFDKEDSCTSFDQSSRHERFSVLTETRGKSAQISNRVSSTSDEQHQKVWRPRTSLPQSDSALMETGYTSLKHRGTWGSRPLSAGPFHRPSLPEVEVARVIADTQLRADDPAVPLISSIKSELSKFTHE